MKKPLRLFYLPNEGVEGDQVGPRLAFEHAAAKGQLGAYQVYSYLVRDKAIGDHARAKQELLDVARAFGPDVIFVQHMNASYPVDDAFIQQLKAIPSNPKFVLWEGDAYGRVFKKIDASLQAVMRGSDIVFLTGMGYVAEAARRYGASKVRFCHNSFDDVRFGTPWEPTRKRPLDVVMISNLFNIKRMPGLYLPGGRQRKQLASAFHTAFGDRFDLYGAGKGWQGEPYLRGPIPFADQLSKTRSAWMSISWDQFPELPMNSSDRPIISLANGIPFLTNYQRGYELAYGDIPGFYWFHSPSEAVDIAQFLLAMPVDRRIEMGVAAAEHMKKHFHADKIYGDVLRVIEEELSS